MLEDVVLGYVDFGMGCWCSAEVEEEGFFGGGVGEDLVFDEEKFGEFAVAGS